MMFYETCIFYVFLDLKFRFGHQKWTSQKWCLEVDTTVSKDFRAKKRFSVLRIIENTAFEVKHRWKLQNMPFWVILSTWNRFLALKSLKTAVSISKHHFWKVHFWWPKWTFRSKKCLKWCLMINVFFAPKMSFWSSKMDFSKMMFRSRYNHF